MSGAGAGGKNARPDPGRRSPRPLCPCRVKRLRGPGTHPPNKERTP
jgi:hypothetical protein